MEDIKMIIINKDLKNGITLNEKNFPHLFDKDERGYYYQVRDFYWNYDADYNLVIETTISDAQKLQEKIENILKNRKKLALQGIENFNKEIKAINEMLAD